MGMPNIKAEDINQVIAPVIAPAAFL